MNGSTFVAIVFGVFFVICLSFVVYQRNEIQKLQEQVLAHKRTRRSTDFIDQPDKYYFPLYTQLSDKALEQLCNKKEPKLQAEPEIKLLPDEANRTKLKNMKYTKTSTEKTRKHRKKMEKTCPSIEALGKKTLFGSRIHRIGSSYRQNHEWFLTEYAMGYTLFEYSLDLNSSAKLEVPSEIYTLPEPFHGTDNTMGLDGQKFYYHIDSSNSIGMYDLKTGGFKIKNLNMGKDPIYKNSLSYVDLELDENALWAIYRKPNETTLTVSKMDPENLKELSRWRLTYLYPRNFTNAFVACGVLYTITFDDNKIQRITKSFDFHTGLYASEWQNSFTFWNSYGHLSNVQYDPKSGTLNVFDSGNIYSIDIIRKKGV